jgi:MerR family copper efflux transcriptional regulator
MNIGAASEKSGLPAKTIRYYEDIGLLTAERASNGYRDYSMTDVHRMRFIQRSRSLGFSVEECGQLLSLYDDKERESADVKALAKTKLAEMDRKLVELTELRDTLRRLVRSCQGDRRPDCPIIEGLSSAKQKQ